MFYSFRSIFVFFFIALFATVCTPVLAQNASLLLFENIQPVTILDRASLFFTFNKEKKVQKLQDISKRYALSGVSVMASGDTIKGQKFLDQSTNTIRQAINTVSQIQDEQIGDRLIASLAYDVVEQSELVQPLQNQEVQTLRTTAQNLLEHNTRLLQTLSDTSFDLGTKKIQEGNIVQAERHLALAESHTARALSVASTLEHENQKQLVGSILDMTISRIENLSSLSKDSSDVRIQASLDKSLRSTTSSLGTFADEIIKKESREKKSDVRVESAFMMLDSVVSLSKLGKPAIQQEILKTAEEKQKTRLEQNIAVRTDDTEIVRITKDSLDEKILDKEIKILLDTQSVGIENAIRNNILSEELVTRIKDSQSRVLQYGKKMPIEKEAEVLVHITDTEEKTSRVIADKKDDTTNAILKDILLATQIEFIANVQDQKIENIRDRASAGVNMGELQGVVVSLEKDSAILVNASLLIQDEIKKEENLVEIKNKSEERKNELSSLSEEYKETVGDVFVSLSEEENVFQATLDSRINEQKIEETARESTVEILPSDTATNTVSVDIQPIIPVVVDESTAVNQTPRPDGSQFTESSGSETEAQKPIAVLPCKVFYKALPVENTNIDIGSTVQFTELEIKTDGCNADIESFAIVVSGSVAPLVSRKMSQSCVQPTSSSFTHEPRIMYWWGKVNLHRDTQTGQWKTDPDGTSGANIDALTYCKKWYPQTVSVKDYKMEISDAWKGAGNAGSNHIALTLDNIRVQDDKGLLSVGPIRTTQNRGLYSVALPNPYKITQGGIRLKLSADIIGGNGLGVILWLSDIIAFQQNSENILPVETQ
ncbi:MAG: hypothetical protein K9M36_03165 [Candidatus Pacebacteria bacterium]|nr:hypothetical protein [Candidatus Paceibacterota bacterium]